MPDITAVVDGHVHIHACYDLDRFFDSAVGSEGAEMKMNNNN